MRVKLEDDDESSSKQVMVVVVVVVMREKGKSIPEPTPLHGGVPCANLNLFTQKPNTTLGKENLRCVLDFPHKLKKIKFQDLPPLLHFTLNTQIMLIVPPHRRLQS